MSDPLRHLIEKNGVFLRREALAAGYDQKTITRLARCGTFHRVRHGAYTFGDVWKEKTYEQRHRITARAVLRSAKSDAVLSHVSAALEYELPVWDLPFGEVHTTRIDGHAGRREAGICHHQGMLGPGDTSELCGIPVTSPARTAIDLATMTDAEHALVPINAMLHEGLATVEDVVRRMDEAQHWPGTLSAHVIKQLLDSRIESPGETRTAHFLWTHGFPRPQPQLHIYDERGEFVARVDFAWPEHGVFLEFDGRAKYEKYLRPGESVADAVIREKLREQRTVEVTGWRCIRIIWSDLNDPERLAERIRSMLDGGPKFAA